MRQTLGSLLTIAQNGAGKDTSTASRDFFRSAINRREELVLSKLPSRFSEIERTFSTVSSQQFYYYPPRFNRVVGLTLNVNGINIPLTPITSQLEWDRLNALDIQPGVFPMYYFNRQRDFGIYPIPQGVYTGTIVYSLRAGGMSSDDIVTPGTVTVSENAQTVTGDATTFETGVRSGMWFSLASSGSPRGNWYVIVSVGSDTELTLETFFEEGSESGANYIIGESPELPEDLHELLAYGALEDYYLSYRQSPAKARIWANMFWTGDSANDNRTMRGANGGLLGAIQRYTDRNNTQLIHRKRVLRPSDIVWATTLSNS